MVQSYHTVRKKSKRQVTDITSWLEAWNRYLVCRIVHTPSMAVELAKYQAVVCLLYPPAACIEYHRLFRQAAARDRSLLWDVPKEDIYVWALTQPSSVGSYYSQHFFRDSTRAPISARLYWDPHLTPPTCQAPGPPTLTLEKKSANSLTLQNVQKATTACSPMHAGTAAAWEITQAGCPKQS